MKLQYKYKNIKYIILYILKSEWNVVEIFSITIQIAQTEIVNLKYAQWKYVNFAKTPIYISQKYCYTPMRWFFRQIENRIFLFFNHSSAASLKIIQ